jgi:penicillin-binding protein activator
MRNIAKVIAVLSLSVVAGMFVAGCSKKTVPTGRVDPDREDQLGGTGTESADIRAMSDKFVRSMMGIPQIANAPVPPNIVLLSVSNQVNDVSKRINADMILDNMRASLNKQAPGKMYFLDRAHMDAVRAERAAIAKGEVTPTTATPSVAGADYFLTGKITSLSKNTAEGESTYIQYNFWLTDMSSRQIWEDQYEAKRVDTRGSVYR